MPPQGGTTGASGQHPMDKHLGRDENFFIGGGAPQSFLDPEESDFGISIHQMQEHEHYEVDELE